jgi:hypothetical protein
MRKLVRDVVAAVRDAGGSNVRVSEGGKHTRIHFTGPEGHRSIVLIHRGTAIGRWFHTAIRSQIRRKLAK